MGEIEELLNVRFPMVIVGRLMWWAERELLPELEQASLGRIVQATCRPRQPPRSVSTGKNQQASD